MMPGKRQMAYQQRKLAAGFCRRCGTLPRLVRRNGKASPYCEGCAAKVAEKDRWRNRKPAAPTPAVMVPAMPAAAIDPDDAIAARRDAALMARRCAGCRQPLPGARYAAGVEFCFDCQPEMPC